MRKHGSVHGGDGGGEEVYVYDAGGNLAAEYPDSLGTPPCTTCYVTVDQLGSTRVLADASGSVVRRYDFMPFGEEIPADGTVRSATYGYQSGWDGFATKFTGQLRDNETGLDYFHARYYSAAQGRFTSADAPLMFATPDDPQGWNLYSYTRNNPLNRIDPDGHQDFILDFGMMDQKARAVELQITTSPSRSSFWGGVLKGFVGGALEGFKSNVHGALG